MRLTSVLWSRAAPATRISDSLRSLRIANAKTYDRRLTHVVSEKLCDDVLHLLQASLPPPHTCDIIDVNPGPCLWSQKLNDLVKPRRHILVEPRRHLFASFIDPLVGQRYSSYRHASTVKQALDPQEGFLSEDIYSYSMDFKTDKKRKFETNEKLLVTANLSGMAKKITGFTGSEAKRFLNDYYRSLFVQHDYIHRYGLARLLAWVGEDARLSIMPTCVNSRTKQSVQLESTCDIEQTAGPSQFDLLHPSQKRWYPLDEENQNNIRKSQKELNLEVPHVRDQPDPVPSFTALQPNVEKVRENKELYPFNQVYITNLLSLDEHLSTEDVDWYGQYRVTGKGVGRGPSSKKQDDKTQQRKQYRILMNQLRTHHTTYLKSRDFITEQRHLFQDYLTRFNEGWFSHETGLPVEGKHHKKAMKLMQEVKDIESQRKLIKADTRSLVSKAGDDYRCYDSNARAMAWNRRRHDPLLVQEDEFFPTKPLTLFDFKPIADTPNTLNTVDKQICFDYVCTLLMTNAGETVLQGIKRLVPAGHDQFIERVPELRDPSKGGWWNLEEVRVRALHHDQFVTLALAFHDWPFRPEIAKLMAIYRGVFDGGPR